MAECRMSWAETFRVVDSCTVELPSEMSLIDQGGLLSSRFLFFIVTVKIDLQKKGATMPKKSHAAAAGMSEKPSCVVMPTCSTAAQRGTENCAKHAEISPPAFYIDSPGPRSSCQSRNIPEGTASWWTAAEMPLLALGRSCSRALLPWLRRQTLPHPGHPVR